MKKESKEQGRKDKTQTQLYIDSKHSTKQVINYLYLVIKIQVRSDKSEA